MKRPYILREFSRRHIRARTFYRYGSDFRRTVTASGYEIPLGLFDICLAGGDARSFSSLGGHGFRLHSRPFLQLAVGDRHHSLVESVDRRIVIPVQGAIKLQLLVGELTELGFGRQWRILLRSADRFCLGLVIFRFCLVPALRFADWLQFSEKIIGKKPWVIVAAVIGCAVGLYFLRFICGCSCRRFSVWRLSCLRFRCRFNLCFSRRLHSFIIRSRIVRNRIILRIIRSYFLHNLLFGCLCQLRIFQLLTYRHPLSGSYELGQIGVEGVMREPGKLDTACRPVKAARKGYAEYLGRFYCVLSEYLIEISDTEQQYGVGMSLFHFPVLV